MSNQGLLLSLALAGAGIWLWRTKLHPGGVRVVAGKPYVFTLRAHPTGDAASWRAAVETSLAASGASVVSLSGVTPSEANLSIRKVSPVTTTIPIGTVLYPAEPLLADATLLGATPEAS